MEISDELCRREVLAIINRWHEITFDEFKRFGKPASHVVKEYRLVIHPELWNAIVDAQFDSHPNGITQSIYKFLDITVVLHEEIEGWKILPLSSLPNS